MNDFLKKYENLSDEQRRNLPDNTIRELAEESMYEHAVRELERGGPPPPNPLKVVRIQDESTATSEMSRDGLPPDHFIVPVTYRSLPSFDEMMCALGSRKDGKPRVNDYIYRQTLVFQKLPSRECVIDTDGERVFHVVLLPKSLMWFPSPARGQDPNWIKEFEAIAKWAKEQRSPFAPNGYLLSTEIELYEFVLRYRLSSWHDLVAYGSYALERPEYPHIKRFAAYKMDDSLSVYQTPGYKGDHVLLLRRDDSE